MEDFSIQGIYALLLSGLAALASFAGALFAGYMKRKGENLATKEDFEGLLAQIKRTTKETELIKQRLASHGWVGQRHWELKERYYTEILENLYKFKITLDERNDFFMEPGSEYSGIYKENEHYKTQRHLGAEAYEKVIRLSGPGAIVLSIDARSALDKFSSKQWLHAMESLNEAEYVSDSLESATNAYEAILAEAKRELAHGGT